MYKQNRLCQITEMLLRQDVSTNNKKDSRPNAPPPHIQQNNAVQPIDTADTPAFITKHSVTEHARAENIARFL